MLDVFSPIFVLHTNIICGYDSVASLTGNMKNSDRKFLKHLDCTEILHETTQCDLIIQRRIQNLV